MEIDKKDIRALSKEQLREFFVTNGDKSFRGNQVYEWLWSKGAHSFEDMTNLSKETRNKSPEIDWKKIIGMRDKITHQYFGIDWEIVWITIKQSLPELKESLEQINNL